MLWQLHDAGPTALPLYADCVICRAPLAEAEWFLVPAPCPGLGRALPAAVAHSTKLARCLVARLPEADAERLWVAALCLGRAQRCSGTSLRPALVWEMLAHFDDGDWIL